MAILGAGHGGAALAGFFAAAGARVMLWAPQDHPGQVPAIKANDNKVIVTGPAVEGSFTVSPTTDIGRILLGYNIVFIITRSDAHGSYVEELLPYNAHLSQADLFVLNGQGFTMTYGRQLNFRRIIETNNFPAAAKIVRDATVNLKVMKDYLDGSCFPIIRNPENKAVFEEDLSETLAALFPTTTINPILPIQIAFSSNFITHAVAGLLNVGRFRDPATALSSAAQTWRDDLDQRHPIPEGWFFYGQGSSNEAVCSTQTLVDQERRMIANACGVRLLTLLEECNAEYGTNYASLAEYALVPTPHNVQYANPTNIEHRYFTEEMWPMEFICAIAERVGAEAPLITATVRLISAARRKLSFSGERYFRIKSLTKDDLVEFGAEFVEYVLFRTKAPISRPHRY